MKLRAWFVCDEGVERILVVKIGFFLGSLILTLSMFDKIPFIVFPYHWHVFWLPWIPCMSSLFSLVISFKYMFVNSNLWYSIDFHARILEFMCNNLGFASIRYVWWHEHVVFGIVYLIVFIKDFTWTSSWVLWTFELFGFIINGIQHETISLSWASCMPLD